MKTERLFSVLNSKVAGVYQAALLIAVSGMLAKVLALFRDRLLAGTFGAGDALDVYFASFRVPDFLYAVSLILATNAAVLPIFMRKEKEGHGAVRDFINRVSGLFILVVLAMIAVAFFMMPHIAPFIAPGFSAGKLADFISLSRVLLLSPFLLGLSALVSSILQSHGRFFIYALSPVLYNAGIIAGILIFYPVFGLVGLAWGVILGALLHFLIQAPSLFSLKLFPMPVFSGFKKDISELLKISLPRSAALGINQLVLLVITAIASKIAIGTIAIFQFAYNLFGIPLGLIGLSYSVAAFPALTRSFVGGKSDEFVSGVTSSLRHIIFWSLPFVVFFIVLRAHIVRVILGIGAFSWTDTRLTAAALGILSIAILAQGIILLLTRAFFAAGRSAFPLVASALSALFTLALTLGAFYFFENHSALRLFGKTLLRVEDLNETSVLLLAFAFSAGSVLNAAFLWLGFNKFFKPLNGVLHRSLWQNVVAAFILGVVSYVLLRLFGPFFNLQTFVGVFLHALSSAFLASVLAGGYLWRVKNREMREIIDAVRNKFWKSSAVAPEPSGVAEG